MLEYDRPFTFTSTGAGAWEDAYQAMQHAWTVETAAGTTATVRVEHRRVGSSIGILLSTAALVMDASSAVTVSVNSALYQVRARVTDMTSTGTVYVHGIGVS